MAEKVAVYLKDTGRKVMMFSVDAAEALALGFHVATPPERPFTVPQPAPAPAVPHQDAAP